MALPADWPDGFPVLPGGQLLKAPPAGHVKVAILAFPGRLSKELDTELRKALAKAGWTAGSRKGSPEAIRYSVTQGDGSVSVSIRDDGGRAILQIMQV